VRGFGAGVSPLRRLGHELAGGDGDAERGRVVAGTGWVWVGGACVRDARGRDKATPRDKGLRVRGRDRAT